MNETRLALAIVAIIVLAFIVQLWRFVSLKIERTKIENVRRETLQDGSVILIYAVTHEKILFEHFKKPLEGPRMTPPPVEPDQVGELAIIFVDASAHFENHLGYVGEAHKADHDHGPKGYQLMTCDELLAAKLVNNRDDYQRAVDWLKGRGYAHSQNGMGKNGIFTKKPLAEVVRDIAVKALPGVER